MNPAGELARWAGREIRPGVRITHIEEAGDPIRRCVNFRIHFRYPGGRDLIEGRLREATIVSADSIELDFEEATRMILDKVSAALQREALE